MEQVDVIQELGQNFIDSAYDVNTNRAFPDARDGFKPGQRCILWDMYKKGYTSEKSHVKSAKVSGSVAASFWPHGTQSIYETFVHMSQPFNNEIPEIDFHGANGNIILGGDSFAADRYTEVRLSKVAEQYLLKGIDKNAVDMTLNFSEDEEMPTVLPAIFPRLLVNGSQGIGVGIANFWCCHNLQETVDMLVNYIKNKELPYNYYPDFPTGGTIINANDVGKINVTGKGKIIVESKYSIDKQNINFTEFPYQVYIEPVIEEIKAGIDSGKIIGIKEVNNKSDKKRILLTVTCAASANPEQVLEQLLKNTSLRKQYNVNQMAIVSKTPTLLTLEDVCRIYEQHNLACIKREYEYDLRKTKDRIEILEGYVIVLSDLDKYITIIKDSDNPKKDMAAKSDLTDAQIDAILSMRLSRLSKLETSKIQKELQEKKKLAIQFEKIVNSEEEQKLILIAELTKLAANFGSTRRTQVIQKEITISPRAKKEKVAEPVIVCYTDNGYIKSIPAAKYRPASGNLGCIETTTDGYIQIYNTKKVYRLKVSSIKQCLASEKGTALGTILGTGLTHIRMISACGENKDVIAVSKSGRIKKFNTSLFNGTTQNIKGQDYFPKNEVLFVIMSEDKYLTFNSVGGYELCSDISTLKTSGKASTGRIGIKLGKEDSIFAIQTSKKPTEYLATLGTKGKNVGCVPH